ncbi:MAG: hypothetical protein ACR2GH_20995 [Pseudonocardia sp.]
MSGDLRGPECCASAVAAHLAAQYGGQLPADIVQTEVHLAERDLSGQVRPESMGELLYQLASYRLHRRIARSGSSSGPTAVADQH